MNPLDALPNTHHEAMDRLLVSTWDCAAKTAIAEAHRLLCCRQHHDAADALLEHVDSIVARARTELEAQQLITRAREAA